MLYDNHIGFRPVNNLTKTAKLTALEIEKNKKDIQKEIHSLTARSIYRTEGLAVFWIKPFT